MQLNDPVNIFTVVLLFVLIVPLLFTRLRISGIAGLIIAGMIAGPNGLGLLARDSTFELLGKVGLLYLMFLAGLEISLREFRSKIGHTLTFGSLTFLFPQVLGTLIAYLLGLNWAAAILMASMFASHTLVPYPIVQRMGIGKHRAVSTTVGGTILTDTAAILILAVVAESVRAGEGGMNWPRQIFLLCLLCFFGIYLLPRIASWFYRVIEPDGITEFVFILSAAFLMSSLAQLAGVEAIIGAFLAGLALSSLVPEQSILSRRLQFSGNALFIPFFLLSTGMLINPAVFISDIRTIQMCLFMTCTGIITKWLASEVSGRLLKFSAAERGVMYGLSVNQAAATLAAVMVGFNLGIFDSAILNGTIAMILITCIVGPLITEHFAPILAQSSAEAGTTISEVAQGPVLVGVSNDQNMLELVDLAVLVREKEIETPLHVLNVAVELGTSADSVGRSEAMLGHVIARLASGGVQAHPQIRMDVNPARAILRALLELRIDTLVVGASHSTARNLFSESLSNQVLQASPCMVLVAEAGRPLNTCRRLIVVIPPLLEKHPGFRRVIKTAVRLESQLGTSLILAGETDTLQHCKGNTALPESLNKAPQIAAPVFKNLLRMLTEKVRTDDIVMLIGARTGSLGWQPALDRLPRDLRRRAQRPNILIAFPPLPTTKEGTPAFAGESVQSETNIERLFLKLEKCPSTPHATIREILKAEQHIADATLGQWIKSLADTEPVELDKGTVLLHAHVKDIAAPRIIVGQFRQSADWTAAARSVNTVILLISPADLPPEQHLESLASIVTWVRSGGCSVEPVPTADGAG